LGRSRSAAPAIDRAALAVIIQRHRASAETVQELAIVALRAAILEGVLPPGCRLRQEDLAGALATSRIPVREALRVLEYEGLVDSEPHRGSTVRALDADRIDEIYDLRTVLEGHAIRLVIPLLTAPDLDELDRLLAALLAAEDDDDHRIARERFYDRLYSVTGRPRLVELITRLRQDAGRSLRGVPLTPNLPRHEELWAAIRASDPERAEQILAADYRRMNALLRRFQREARRGAEGDRP
jgi:DNA-binding GntR family transcriptional regulator